MTTTAITMILYISSLYAGHYTLLIRVTGAFEILLNRLDRVVDEGDFLVVAVVVMLQQRRRLMLLLWLRRCHQQSVTTFVGTD